MAVTVLSAATFVTGASPTTPFTSLTHTCPAGSNRLLVIFLGWGDPTAFHSDATPRYGGEAGVVATAQIGTGVNNGIFVGTEVWYWNEAAIVAAGSAVVSIDVEAGGGHSFDCVSAGAVCLAGVDQATPIDTGSVQTSAAEGTTASVTIAIAAGNLGLASIMSDAETGLSAETETQLYETPAIASDCVGAAQYSADAGSIPLGWTQGNFGYAVLGFEVNAAAGGGPPTVLPDPAAHLVRPFNMARGGFR